MASSKAMETETTEVFVDAVANTTSDWFMVPRNFIAKVRGISGESVILEHRAHPNDTDVETLYTFTADGSQANSDGLYEVRMRITSYSAGTINAYLIFNYE